MVKKETREWTAWQLHQDETKKMNRIYTSLQKKDDAYRNHFARKAMSVQNL